ncbi:BglG family transcription antiterminator [Tepidimicrobium xylanilyticum]|uniref:BglG family transcription antiterminator n=1 Tax=Tepidimicrobium xylanilyticum TaxID=1123352 RepID=UPI00264CEA04|nr:PTS sugar transporter subunit IIA [Tepidimicrobium xylanilyticum]GMG95609.1 bifunctional protein [Tepidimicrobium xylanilyticum]
MNRRLYNILFYIYENPQNLSIEFLAEKLGISERTLNSDIDILNKILFENKLGVIEAKNGYINYSGNSVDIKAYLEALDFYEYTLTKEERIIVEVLLLLFVQEKIILSDMADIMHVSRSSVIGDQKVLEKRLLESGLSLYSKSNYGIKIKGLESNIRKLYIKLLIQERMLVQIFLNQELPTSIMGEQFKLLSKYDKTLQTIINEAESISNLTLTGYSNWILKEYLKFSIYRMKKGFYVDNTSFFNSFNSYNSTLIDNLYPMVVDYFELEESFSEKCLLKYLAQYFRFSHDSMEIFIENILETQTIVRKFIESVSIDMNIPIYKDYELFEKLSSHLDRIFGRKREKIILYPEVEKVVNENLHIKEVISNNISILENHFNITMTEAEIAYIVIYICASIERLKQQSFDANIIIVCNSGYGTSQLLKYKLEEHFLFNIKEIVPAHKLIKNEDLLKDVDFIISTVDLDIDFPYVKINPLLTERDIININSMVLKLESLSLGANGRDRQNQRILLNKIKAICQPYDDLYERIKPIIDDYFSNLTDSIYLHSLLTEEFIQVDVDAYDWKDSIEKASKILLEKSFITEDYIHAMIENYNKNGPYFVIVPNFALPHAPIDAGSKNLGMSLIRLSNPVKFYVDGLDPIKFICVISAVDNKKHLKAVFNLINLLKIDDFRNEIDGASNPKEMADIIKRYEKTLI